MNREQKAEFIEDMRGRLADAPFIVLTDWKGSTVKELDLLRRACEPAGAHYRVVKNTLCRIALSGTEKDTLSEHFVGTVGVFLSGEDPIAAAKLLKEQLKSNKNLSVKAGFFEGELLDEKGVAAIADLPSREELLVLLLRTIQEGPRQVLGVLQGPPRDLLYLLNNYANKLEEGDQA